MNKPSGDQFTLCLRVITSALSIPFESSADVENARCCLDKLSASSKVKSVQMAEAGVGGAIQHDQGHKPA
jgi:hypothetical protein